MPEGASQAVAVAEPCAQRPYLIHAGEPVGADAAGQDGLQFALLGPVNVTLGGLGRAGQSAEGEGAG